MDCFESILKEHILSKKCSQHPSMICDFLNLDPQTSQHRVCIICMEQQKIPIKQIISIASIMNCDSSNEFELYPLEQYLLEMYKCNFDLEDIQIEANKYFDRLKEKLDSSIMKMINSERTKIESVITKLKNTQELLGALLSVKEIQNLLFSEAVNSDDQLHEYIVQHYSPESLKIIEQINQSYLEIDKFQTQFQEPPDICKQILPLIESITLFKGSKRKRLFPLLEVSKKWDETMLQCSMQHNPNQEKFEIQRVDENKHILVTCLKQPIYHVSFYLTPQLVRDQKYIIRLEQNSSNNYNGFLYGLINSIWRHSDSIMNSHIYYTDWDGGISKSLIRGKYLHTIKEKNKKFEFRIQISEKYWRVSTFPDYENVVSLSGINFSAFHQNNDYHFGFKIQNVLDSVKILEVIEVSVFDNKMSIFFQKEKI